MDITVNRLIRRNGKLYYPESYVCYMYSGRKMGLNLSIQSCSLKKVVPTCKLISKKLQMFIKPGIFEMVSVLEIRRIEENSPNNRLKARTRP